MLAPFFVYRNNWWEKHDLVDNSGLLCKKSRPAGFLRIFYDTYKVSIIFKTVSAQKSSKNRPGETACYKKIYFRRKGELIVFRTVLHFSVFLPL